MENKWKSISFDETVSPEFRPYCLHRGLTKDRHDAAVARGLRQRGGDDCGGAHLKLGWAGLETRRH